MTEAEARRWVADRFGVSRETLVAQFAEHVITESSRQNLVSKDSLASLWFRHIVDSAQLLALTPAGDALWVDIGTGAGFPGVIVALLSDRPVLLVEPRRRRADFLTASIAALGVSARVEVVAARVETATATAGVISARAVAALPDVLAMARHLSTDFTQWLLPKGARAREEVAAARRSWHGLFHVEQSITDPQSLIVIAKGVSPK